jgi:O-antigen/teichoic acid export membrane protein
MGIFNAANQWFTALLFLPGILGHVMLPILSERIGEKDKKNSRKMLSLSIKLNFFSTAPIVFILCFFSHHIMALYGQNFSSGSLTLVVILMTACLLSIQIPVGNVIAASGFMWIGFFMNLAWALFFLSITWATLNWGSLGLASARGMAYIVHATWTFIFAFYFLSERKGITENAI